MTDEASEIPVFHHSLVPTQPEYKKETHQKKKKKKGDGNR